MLSVVLIILCAFLDATRATAALYSPYTDPLAGAWHDALLAKRQNCRSGYSACSNLGAAGVCCPSNNNCALDTAGNVACCPVNAVCTGTIAGTRIGSATPLSTSSSGPVLGGTSTSASVTSFGGTTAVATGVAGGGSTVPNNFFPFIYIPTSYANAALCTSAYSSCQTASTSCFLSLAGANGVTVAGLGGGITVAGATGTILTSASSICSSLSAQGCYNLQETQCSIFGGGTGSSPTTTTGFVQVGNDGPPRQTACSALLYAAGMFAGAAGGFI